MYGCPSGKKIVGIIVACNLETVELTDRQLSQVPLNTVEIKRDSDPNSLYSMCHVGDHKLRTGRKSLTDVLDLNMIEIGCKEHDANRGDCRVMGILYCR